LYGIHHGYPDLDTAALAVAHLAEATGEIPVRDWPLRPLLAGPRASATAAARLVMPSRRMYAAMSGGTTWTRLLQRGGVLGELVPGTRGTRSLASDGHPCRSMFERQIEEWLIANRIPHEVEPTYPYHRALNPSGSRRADWLLDGWLWVEAAGMVGEPAYDATLREKVQLAESLGLPHVVVTLPQVAQLEQVLGARLGQRRDAPPSEVSRPGVAASPPVSPPTSSTDGQASAAQGRPDGEPTEPRERSWSDVGVDEEDGETWRLLGIQPAEAEPFLDASGGRMPPEAVAVWLETGLPTERAVALWEHGIDPADVPSSEEERELELFDDEGITAEEVPLWTGHGITDPVVAGAWAAAGFTPEEAAEWLDLGILRPLHARQWISVGCTPREAERWRARGCGTAFAAEAARAELVAEVLDVG
jgi:hypothetical protein